MIYVTGDTHGNAERFDKIRTPEGNELTADDKLIICGDFGFVFYHKSYINEFKKSEEDLDYLENLPYEILFVSGNHENFDRLAEYPEEIRYGGRVKKIRSNIYLLMRGEIFSIEHKTFFAMGGAYSMDRAKRRKGYTWWNQELPDKTEYRNASDNLKKYDHKVDYVITHTAPQTVIYLMGKHPDYHDAELTGFFDWMWHDVDFKHWYFGHWHDDKKVDLKATVCYEKTLRI